MFLLLVTKVYDYIHILKKFCFWQFKICLFFIFCYVKWPDFLLFAILILLARIATSSVWVWDVYVFVGVCTKSCLVWWWHHKIFSKYFSIMLLKSQFSIVITQSQKKILVSRRQFWHTEQQIIRVSQKGYWRTRRSLYC